MGYFSIEHLKVALAYTTGETHASILSVLALALAGADIGEDVGSTVIGGGTAEINMIKKFFRIPGVPESRPYALMFGPHLSSSRLKNGKYPGASLQRQRQGKRNVFWQPSPGDRRWSFASGSIKALKDDPGSVVGATLPIRTGMLAAWFYRERDVVSVQAAVDAFVAEFRLADLGFVPDIFEQSAPAELTSVPLADAPPDTAEVLELIRTFDPPSGSVPADSEDAPVSSTPVVKAREAPGDWASGTMDEDALGELKGVEEAARRASAALAAGLHVIFTGPPGTGKTTLAKAVVKNAGFPSWVVPATDAWTTFETIGGYFPVPGSGGDRLDFLPGAVVGAIEDGKCLIIDEINRADIDKAFGELFTLLTGSSVTLPYRRRGDDGRLRQIRLQLGAALDDDQFDLVPVPDWWRMIGAMNDVDKASLKRLSMAFIRRFAFVPIDVPPPDVYEAIVRSLVGRTSSAKQGHAGMQDFGELMVKLFAKGALATIGLQLGPAFPKAAIRQADAEWTADPQRSTEAVAASCIELHVMPQMQGREEIHQQFLDLVGPHVGEAAADLERHLEVWSGFVRI